MTLGQGDKVIELIDWKIEFVNIVIDFPLLLVVIVWEF